MKIYPTTMADVGTAIRALRKHGGIRIDDFALLAKASKQFIGDVETGKPTVQMGRVLELLGLLGAKVSIEIPDAVEPTLTQVRTRRKEKTARLRATRAAGGPESDAP